MAKPYGALVAAPERQPLPYGLFSVLTPTEGDQIRWGHGLRLDSLPCGAAAPVPLNFCSPSEWPEFDQAEITDFGAFTVPVSVRCSIIGSDSDFAAQAEKLLLATEQRAAEQWLWSTFVDRDWGESAPGDTLGKIVAGLEDQISETYGSLGVFHVSRGTALLLLKDGFAEVKGSRLQTKVGTPIVAGAGYSQNGIAVTGPLVGFRSEIYRPEVIDQGLNNKYSLAARDYAIGFEDCLFSALTFERN